MKKITEILTVISFLGVLGILCAANLIKPSDEISYSERRRLAQFPQITSKTIINAQAMKDFNSYATDQFIYRDRFRTVKAVFDMKIWQRADNNAIFTVGDYVYKTEYPLRENSIKRLCGVINYIYNNHLTGMNVKYALIPDKNYYIDDTRRHLVIDYEAMKSIVRANITEEISEIDLFEILGRENYYMTDAHWKQETLGGVTDIISAAMGSSLRFDRSGYVQKSYYPFYGAYYGQSALNVNPDELVYLTDEHTENAIVTSVEVPDKYLDVYDETQLGGIDSYNLFLHGPQAVIRAENRENTGTKELIIFRDSFSSSLAPLLLPGYSAVTLVDLRYIIPDLLGEIIEFDNQDILFLYSAGIYNNSDSIKTPIRQEFISPFIARGAGTE